MLRVACSSMFYLIEVFFFFSSRRRHTRFDCDWSSDVCSSRAEIKKGPMLSVNDLSLNFGGLRAVDGVSFTVETGRIHGLIGPNGAGKTTIFTCVTGFYRPASGSLRLLDHGIPGLRPHQIA